MECCLLCPEWRGALNEVGDVDIKLGTTPVLTITKERASVILPNGFTPCVLLTLLEGLKGCTLLSLTNIELPAGALISTLSNTKLRHIRVNKGYVDIAAAIGDAYMTLEILEFDGGRELCNVLATQDTRKLALVLHMTAIPFDFAEALAKLGALRFLDVHLTGTEPKSVYAFAEECRGVSSLILETPQLVDLQELERALGKNPRPPVCPLVSPRPWWRCF